MSVVTPVHNGAAHLRECVESVLAQTYRNWDYTIVDNRSTDGTRAIADEYARRDARIRARSNAALLPIIESHNEAFRQISPGSRYCKVVAADDGLLPDCLTKMVALAEANPGVAIVGAWATSGDGVKYDGLPPGPDVIAGRDACRRHFLGTPYFFGTPTSVLYRSDIVRSRRAFYNERNLHADTEACLEFLDGRDFGCIREALSFERAREASNTSYARSLNTYLHGELHALLAYGPRVLSETERRALVRRLLRKYHDFLGSAVFARRDAAFWSHHRAKLAELGYPLCGPTLASAVLRVAARSAARRFRRAPTGGG